jgi:hypothetical protein
MKKGTSKLHWSVRVHVFGDIWTVWTRANQRWACFDGEPRKRWGCLPRVEKFNILRKMGGRMAGEAKKKSQYLAVSQTPLPHLVE